MKRLPAAPEIWTDVLERDPAATFYQTPVWRDIITGAFPQLRDASVAYQLDDGHVAFMPRLEDPGRYGVLRSWESTFPGTYGGWLVGRDLADEESVRLYEAVDNRTAFSGTVTLPPGCKGTPVPPGYQPEVDTTHILRTRSRLDPDGSVRWERPAVRRAVAKAARAGLEIRQAVNVQDYRAYYQVYADTLDRWGDHATSRYPWTLFETGYASSQRTPGAIRLWLATLGPAVVAGMWVFYWKENAYYWHSAVLRSHMKLRPMDLLVTAVTEHAAHNGFSSFDLMPSGGHTGVARFKEKFGAQRVPVHRLRRVRPLPAAFARGVARVRRLLPNPGSP